ncbi:MAG: thiaminase II [Nitrososphaeraceae archaeon]
MATFADELKLCVVETWQRILNHKFINEIYNGTLPIDKFIFYLEQDRIFLDEFCRFLRVVKQKSDNNIDLVKLFDNILYSTVNFEMKMQDQIIADSSNLSSSSPSSDIRRNHHLLPSKTILEYTFYLGQVSSNGSMGECVSVMMPCPWTYLEIAQKLSKSHHIQDNQVYKKWARFYSSDESCMQVNDLKKILCVLADDEKANDKDRLAMKQHFTAACRYELLFWDTAYGS